MVSIVRVARLSVVFVERIACLTVIAVVGCWWRSRRWRARDSLIRARVLLLLVRHVSVIPGTDALRRLTNRMKCR